MRKTYEVWRYQAKSDPNCGSGWHFVSSHDSPQAAREELDGWPIAQIVEKIEGAVS
jgi:hypothetical protein